MNVSGLLKTLANMLYPRIISSCRLEAKGWLTRPRTNSQRGQFTSYIPTAPPTIFLKIANGETGETNERAGWQERARCK